MIGGNGIVIPAIGDAASLEACLQIVQRRWPEARFEDAVSGDKYARYEEMPLDHVHEVLVYTDAEAEAAWDADSPDSPPNSMPCLIASPRSVTAVLDDPSTPDMTAILESMKAAWGADLRNRSIESEPKPTESVGSARRVNASAKTKNHA